MTTPYSYRASSDFINELKFDYAETYSFQRGIEWEEYLKSALTEYQALHRRKEIHRITKEQEEKYEYLHKLTTTQFLIDADGNFHASSEKIQTLKKNDFKLKELVAILEVDANDVPAWMCGPVYRDAIVFYDNSGQIISTLNICFSCQYMATKMFSEIMADVKVYHLLRDFFVELGHEIEQE